MSELRIWHPSRDPYHCAFRMVRLLVEQADAISIERLRILDMLLLYPSLLHRMRLTLEMKTEVRTIESAKPEKTFVRLPSLPSIWQDLRVYQAAALKHLAGRGLLRREAFMDRHARLEENQVPAEVMRNVMAANAAQLDLMDFLIGKLAAFEVDGTDGLAQRTRLPARGPVL